MYTYLFYIKLFWFVLVYFYLTFCFLCLRYVNSHIQYLCALWSLECPLYATSIFDIDILVVLFLIRVPTVHSGYNHQMALLNLQWGHLDGDHNWQFTLLPVFGFTCGVTDYKLHVCRTSRWGAPFGTSLSHIPYLSTRHFPGFVSDIPVVLFSKLWFLVSTLKCPPDGAAEPMWEFGDRDHNPRSVQLPGFYKFLV